MLEKQAYTNITDAVKNIPGVFDRNTGVGSAAGGGEIVASPKVFDNAQVRSTPAGQKGQVVFLDPKGWYLMGSTGPTALLNNVAQLKQAYRAAQK